jgi:CubicO group peptidase (beta-lactamase class C family)
VTVIETEPLTGLLEQAVADAVVPGAIAAVTDARGEITIAAAGRTRVGAGTPVAPDTMFALMSMTKAVATVGALQLVEQGRLALDQTVASILPQYGELQVLEGFDGDAPVLRPPRSQATVRQLMNHTAGHGYSFNNPALLRYQRLTATPAPLSSKLAVLRMPLIADPGTAWNYGVSTDWLGQLVEAVSGRDLAAYLREHVCGPLGMSDFSFMPRAAQRRRLMAPHSRTATGGLEVAEWFTVPPADPEFAAAGHGAFGTGRDYARFMAMLLAGGTLDGARILSPETVELVFSDQLHGIRLPAGTPASVQELSNDVPGFPFEEGWGLGLHLCLQHIPGMRHAGSGDWAGVCNCFFWVDRDAGIAGTLLTSVLPFFDERIVALSNAVEQAAYAGR